MDNKYSTAEQISFNRWLEMTRKYWMEDSRRFMKHLFSIGYTYDKIGREILKVSKQAVEQKYPKEVILSEE